MDYFGTNNKQADLAMAILESFAVADSGKTLCQGCYTLEGDSPLIFTAKEAMDIIKTELQIDIQMPRVIKIVDTVVNLINEGENFASIESNELQKKVYCVGAYLKNTRNILAISHNDMDAPKGITIPPNGRISQAPRRH